MRVLVILAAAVVVLVWTSAAALHFWVAGGRPDVSPTVPSGAPSLVPVEDESRIIAEEFLRQAALGDNEGACGLVVMQATGLNNCLADLDGRKDFLALGAALDDAVVVSQTHKDGRTGTATVTDADLIPKPSSPVAIKLVMDTDGLWYVRFIGNASIKGGFLPR